MSTNTRIPSDGILAHVASHRVETSARGSARCAVAKDFDCASARRKTEKEGFSLVELMATLAVLAVVVTIAIPGLQAFVQRNRLAAINNDLMTAIALARSEAIRRTTPITLCPSNDGATCSGSWSDGWIVFVNADNDNPPVVDTGETLLRVFPPLPSGYTLNSTAAFTTHLTYDRAGAANAAGTFIACHNSDESRARGVTVTRLRPRIAVDTDGDGIPNTDNGNVANCENP